MQITLKTLQQNTFKVEIAASETVAALKRKIEADKGDAFPAEGQKLIYAGKILGKQALVVTGKTDWRVQFRSPGNYCTFYVYKLVYT